MIERIPLPCVRHLGTGKDGEMSDHMTIPVFGGETRQVRGVLADEAALQNATQALLTAGFDRGDLSVPNPDDASSDLTSVANPVDEHDVRQTRTLANSTIGVAGALIGGAVASVATGGALLPVAAVAVASAAGAGGLAHINLQGTADQREQHHDSRGAAGTLVLAALVRDAEKEQLAMTVLREAGATAVEAISMHGTDTRIS